MKNANSLGNQLLKMKRSGLQEEQKFAQGSDLPPESPDISVSIPSGASGYGRSPDGSFTKPEMPRIPLFSRKRPGDNARKELGDGSQQDGSGGKGEEMGGDRGQPARDHCDGSSSSSFSSSSGSSLGRSVEGGQASLYRKFNLFLPKAFPTNL